MAASCFVTDDANFGQPLYSKCKLVVHKFVVLCRHCLQGGLDDLDRIVQQYVVRLCQLYFLLD